MDNVGIVVESLEAAITSAIAEVAKSEYPLTALRVELDDFAESDEASA